MDKLIIMLLEIVPYIIFLLLIIAGAWYGLRLLRANLLKPAYTATEYLNFFQILHEEGKISDEEYRTIKRLVSLHIIQNSEKP